MWTWMDHYRPRIEKQLRMLGCSVDWSRPNFTMEPSKQRAVRTHFIRLYKRGLLYRADRIVHWCLRNQTTYSDLESEHVTRTDPLYYVRYPWADPMPPGTPDVIVATTRPETIVADVAIAVHPDHARWKAFVGKHVLVPGVERRVPIIADEAVDPAFGTGALKITPGHDATDFEIGQRHGLPVISVIDKRGYMTPAAGPLAGPDRETARRQMVELLRAKGLLVKEEPITHAVGVHDRCKTVDEPLVMELGELAARHAGLAGWPSGSAPLLPGQRARDGLRHPLLLGGSHDHDGHREHARGPVPHGVPPRADPRRLGEDEQVRRQRRKPGRLHRGARGRRAALRAGQRRRRRCGQHAVRCEAPARAQFRQQALEHRPVHTRAARQIPGGPPRPRGRRAPRSRRPGDALDPVAHRDGGRRVHASDRRLPVR